MRKLNIGTEKYTQVFACDDKEFNANHAYVVKRAGDSSEEAVLGAVYFQKDPIKESGINGVMNEDLIAMVIDRLESFQASPFKCEENYKAMTALGVALYWLRERTNKREARGVEGTHEI